MRHAQVTVRHTSASGTSAVVLLGDDQDLPTDEVALGALEDIDRLGAILGTDRLAGLVTAAKSKPRTSQLQVSEAEEVFGISGDQAGRILSLGTWPGCSRKSLTASPAT